MQRQHHAAGAQAQVARHRGQRRRRGRRAGGRCRRRSGSGARASTPRRSRGRRRTSPPPAAARTWSRACESSSLAKYMRLKSTARERRSPPRRCTRLADTSWEGKSTRRPRESAHSHSSSGRSTAVSAAASQALPSAGFSRASRVSKRCSRPPWVRTQAGCEAPAGRSQAGSSGRGRGLRPGRGRGVLQGLHVQHARGLQALGGDEAAPGEQHGRAGAFGGVVGQASELGGPQGHDGGTGLQHAPEGQQLLGRGLEADDDRLTALHAQGVQAGRQIRGPGHQLAQGPRPPVPRRRPRPRECSAARARQQLGHGGRGGRGPGLEPLPPLLPGEQGQPGDAARPAGPWPRSAAPAGARACGAHADASKSSVAYSSAPCELAGLLA